MRTAALGALIFAVFSLWVSWSVAPKELRAETKLFVSRHWWKLPLVGLVLFGMAAALGLTSVKLY